MPDPECERERPYVHMSPWTLRFSPALEDAYCNAMTQGSGAVRKVWASSADMGRASSLCMLEPVVLVKGRLTHGAAGSCV